MKIRNFVRAISACNLIMFITIPHHQSVEKKSSLARFLILIEDFSHIHTRAQSAEHSCVHTSRTHVYRYEKVSRSRRGRRSLEASSRSNLADLARPELAFLVRDAKSRPSRFAVLIAANCRQLTGRCNNLRPRDASMRGIFPSRM